MKRSKMLSAGLLMYRKTVGGDLEFFLVHPGGPFWKNKDLGAWTIPKGAVGDTITNETPIEAARREFVEETGFAVREPLIDLGSIRQKSGKTVQAWAFEADCNPQSLRCNSFALEWPPKSGQFLEFPEVDRGEYFGYGEAKRKINAAQIPFLDRLQAALEHNSPPLE